MEQLTEDKLLAAGLKQLGNVFYWQEENGAVSISLILHAEGWKVYPYDALGNAWPKLLNYWEELAPILAAVRVGY